MKRKIFVILAAVFAMVVLAGCGNTKLEDKSGFIGMKSEFYDDVIIVDYQDYNKNIDKYNKMHAKQKVGVLNEKMMVVIEGKVEKVARVRYSDEELKSLEETQEKNGWYKVDFSTKEHLLVWLEGADKPIKDMIDESDLVLIFEGHTYYFAMEATNNGGVKKFDDWYYEFDGYKEVK